MPRFSGIWLMGVLALTIPAWGQAPPFFGGGVVAFDPEPAVITSGVLLDVQGVVSADRKYVTLTMRPTRTGLRALLPFPVNIVTPGGGGFVGGVTFPMDATAQTAVASNTTSITSNVIDGNTAVLASRPRQPPQEKPDPDAELYDQFYHPSPNAINDIAKSWVFTRQGMYLVKPLD